MMSLMEVRPSSAGRPLSMPPCCVSFKCSSATPACEVVPAPPPCKASKGRSLVERAQNRRSWHLNGARDRLPSLAITLTTSSSSSSSSSVAVRRGVPSPLRVTVSTVDVHTDGLQSPPCVDVFSPPSEREEAPELRGASQILPYLFIGSENDAKDQNKLEALNIGYVLNVTGHVPCYFNGQQGYEYERIPANDSEKQDLKHYFRDAIDFIDRARRSKVGCLVHCVAGVSRSPTIVLAYLMYYYGKTMMEAYNFVKERRSWIAPNINFVGQLYDYECELKRNHCLRKIRSLDNEDSDLSSDESPSVSMDDTPADSRTASSVASSNSTDSGAFPSTSSTVAEQEKADELVTFSRSDNSSKDAQADLFERAVFERTELAEPCRSAKLRTEYHPLTSVLLCAMKTTE